jgi:hypothetical protein
MLKRAQSGGIKENIIDAVISNDEKGTLEQNVYAGI